MVRNFCRACTVAGIALAAAVGLNASVCVEYLVERMVHVLACLPPVFFFFSGGHAPALGECRRFVDSAARVLAKGVRPAARAERARPPDEANVSTYGPFESDELVLSAAILENRTQGFAHEAGQVKDPQTANERVLEHVQRRPHRRPPFVDTDTLRRPGRGFPGGQ